MTVPDAPILEVEAVSKTFVVARHLGRPPDVLHALVGVSLSVPAGQVLGIVGESGSGKTTLARIIVRLLTPDSGRVILAGRDLTHLSGDDLREARKGMQMVFQDPYSSLNPRMKIGDAIEEPLRAHHVVADADVSRERDSLLARVGLSPRMAERLPRELSGGQRQRVSIARALSVRPKVLIADEAVSSLDVSVRAQILNLLSDLQDKLALTLVFISHDLSVIHHVSDLVAVLYFGRLVEYGPTAEVLQNGAHPYTRGLIAAIPRATRSAVIRQPSIRGELPSAIKPITGCVFQTRCPIVKSICAVQEPPQHAVAPDHWAACHFAPSVAQKDPVTITTGTQPVV